MTVHGSVLVVDDDDDFRETLEGALRSCGYTTLGAGDGVEAQAVLQRGVEPGLILLDLRMPRMNGLEFLAWLREGRPDSHIPIVMITGDTTGAREAEHAGTVAVLRKPFDIDDLLEAVEKLGR